MKTKDKNGNWIDVEPIMPMTNFEIFERFYKKLNESKYNKNSTTKDFEIEMT